MTSRKKNLFLIQFTIFFIAIALLYNTYSVKDKNTEVSVEIVSETKAGTNSFTDIEYSGFDLNGNRYLLKAGLADFKTETPELINMKEVVANFYFKDNTILTVTSSDGLYNNITLDMEFTNNVTADYLTHSLLSNFLSYSNTNSELIASGNVRGKSVEKGEFSADTVKYSLSDKTLNLSMFGSEQVNIKLKN